MKLCHTCENSDMTYSINCNPKEAKWIRQEKLEPVPVSLTPKECKIQYPKDSDIELTVKQKKIPPSTKILYWAANKKPLEKAHNITNALTAYDRKNNKKVKNFGCTRVKKDGSIPIKIISPQCYIERGKLWPKHIHFIEEGENDTWKKENFYTISGLPLNNKELTSRCIKKGNVYVTPEQVEKNWKKGNFYMVCALPKSQKTLVDFEKYKGLNHIHIDKEKKNLNIPKGLPKETPLVLYCLKKSCPLAQDLILKLTSRGYQNIFLMEEGITGFSKEIKDSFTEKDKKTSSKKLKSMISV